MMLPDDDGRLVFRVAESEWHAIYPLLITDAREDPEGQLRVEMGPTYALVIRTIP